MLKKLLIVYNPRSSHHETVTKEVLSVARKVRGWMVGKCEIKESGFDSNVAEIAKLLEDGDLVIAAGGDGTAAMVSNAIMRSEKQAVLGVLGYGNFNDIAGMLGVARPVEYGGEYVGGVREIIEGYETGRIARMYPLEVRLDGELWRYAVAYFTVGMLAKSTEVFDKPEVRKKLQTGRKGRVFSISQLAKWYFHGGKKTVLPEGVLNGVEWQSGSTDYLAVNGPKVAGVMQGGDWYQEAEAFLGSVQALGRLSKLMKFMLESMRKRIPGYKTEKDEIRFKVATAVDVHAEGEHEVKKVQKIEVKKVKRPIRVVLGAKGVV